jgi:ABC-type multidrug transport system permease subunit
MKIWDLFLGIAIGTLFLLILVSVCYAQPGGLPPIWIPWWWWIFLLLP